MPFMGGNSVKATSGINGALTKTQMKAGIQDSAELFEADTIKSAAGLNGTEAPAYTAPLAKVLAHESGPAVDWLTGSFGLDLSLVSRLGGHSQPRTHRGNAKFPGFTITYALLERLSPGTRKLEIFGREHNTRPGWVTLGNQLPGVRLPDEALRARFLARYPERRGELV